MRPNDASTARSQDGISPATECPAGQNARAPLQAESASRNSPGDEGRGRVPHAAGPELATFLLPSLARLMHLPPTGVMGDSMLESVGSDERHEPGNEEAACSRGGGRRRHADAVQVDAPEGRLRGHRGRRRRRRSSGGSTGPPCLRWTTFFDLIVSDIRMPDLTAIQVLSAMRNTVTGTPVILVTAYDDAATRREALELGVCAVLAKPVARDDLRAALRSVALLSRMDRSARCRMRELDAASARLAHATRCPDARDEHRPAYARRRPAPDHVPATLDHGTVRKIGDWVARVVSRSEKRPTVSRAPRDASAGHPSAGRRPSLEGAGWRALPPGPFPSARRGGLPPSDLAPSTGLRDGARTLPSRGPAHPSPSPRSGVADPLRPYGSLSASSTGIRATRRAGRSAAGMLTAKAASAAAGMLPSRSGSRSPSRAGR